MTDKEYQDKKRECLLDFCREYDYKITPAVERIFVCAFDRAYALGKKEAKQETNSSQNGNTSNYSKNFNSSQPVTGNHFPDVRKMVDTRLNIAVSIAAGWIACHGMTNPKTIAMDALAVADALIAECEKGEKL